MTTRNFADVIRAKMDADPELKKGVEEAMLENEAEQRDYDEEHPAPLSAWSSDPPTRAWPHWWRLKPESDPFVVELFWDGGCAMYGCVIVAGVLVKKAVSQFGGQWQPVEGPKP